MKDSRALIDWWFVVRNGLWIAGAALVLSSWSYRRWIVASGRASRAEIPDHPSWITSSAAGALLLCIGFMTLGGPWSAILWGVLAVIAAARLWFGLRKFEWNP